MLYLVNVNAAFNSLYVEEHRKGNRSSLVPRPAEYCLVFDNLMAVPIPESGRQKIFSGECHSSIENTKTTYPHSVGADQETELPDSINNHGLPTRLMVYAMSIPTRLKSYTLQFIMIYISVIF